MTWFNSIRTSLLAAALSAGPAPAMTLSDALEQALAHDPTLPVARAEYDAAREDAPQTRATLRPSVNVDANAAYTYNDTQGQFFGSFTENYPSYGVGVQLRQPLYRYDWSARLDRAVAEDAQADAMFDAALAQLSLRVAQRYFGVLQASDNLRFAVAEAAAARQSLQDVQERFSVGSVARTDVREAQARGDLAEARVIAARNALVAAQDLLQESTGGVPQALPPLKVDLPLVPPEPANAEHWAARALQDNPTLRQARQQVDIARTDARGAQAALRPELDAVANVRHNDSDESFTGQKSNDGSIQLQLTQPLYSGGAGSSRVRQTTARLAAARADLTRLGAEIQREVRRAYRDVGDAIAQVRAFTRAVDSAAAAEIATQNGYEAGKRTITDVLNARSDSISARRDLAAARYAYVLNLLTLKQLAGHLGMADFQALDTYLADAPGPD